MEAKFKGKIISALRKLTWSWKPYNNVKNAAKVDAACFECSSCGKYCYDGKSERNLKKLQDKYPNKNVQKETIYIDHIDPVIPLEHWNWDWNDYISRIFCSEENLQPLCKECHNEKSNIEKEIRKNLRKKLTQKKKSGKITP